MQFIRSKTSSVAAGIMCSATPQRVKEFAKRRLKASGVDVLAAFDIGDPSPAVFRQIHCST